MKSLLSKYTIFTLCAFIFLVLPSAPLYAQDDEELPFDDLEIEVELDEMIVEDFDDDDFDSDLFLDGGEDFENEGDDALELDDVLDDIEDSEIDDDILLDIDENLEAYESTILGEGPVQNGLRDLESYQWKESVQFLYDMNIVEGYQSEEFKPNQLISRAEFTKIVLGSVYNSADIEGIQDKDCFSDVSENNWFAPYVCLAQKEGIIDGYSDGSFKPQDTINQAEALKIIIETFVGDQKQENREDWYTVYFDVAHDQGMYYFTTTDSPAAQLLTRGEMAYFMAWMLNENGSDQIQPIQYKD